MTLSRLVVWRHGQTGHNASGRLQGHLDVDLNDIGREQARAAAPHVAKFEPDVFVVSDLQRAANTAATLTELTGWVPRVDKRLRETDVGQWMGMSGEEVERDFPGALDTWRADPTFAPPGGESRVEVAARAAEVVADLDLEHDGTALLCAHGGLITGLVGRLLGLPVETWPQLGGLSNCHWTVLARRGDTGRWRLLNHNVGATG
ncbi:2,3-bisphosphoglycerate-dependent phosphoglycerate mutase/probable phosphoglycerate mutase [Crossiella equi]|uniref:2,3-bisphosphoglycerate-dependent phosphoglycerate mutase/probable phosphoglycerate mutase n=1 Tax=Crossiella equi TaxID=130796 RepID=A0ABS5ACX3_9PSEU|nr:histidine phosphatase family protein [Crossiella equi]MBP2474147.1 2,3-bisphosphoglycerate-dependent phosphoglycerate mutase/probable phosphoglycerate mutase [Crossiella equi]